jgi:hypothetical protein
LLTRTREITLLLKNNSQRSSIEQQEVARGLLRAVLLEGCVFLPASVLLVLIVIRPLILLSPFLASLSPGAASQAVYGLLGILSYQFPFAAVRRVVTRIALQTLQSYTSIALKEDGMALPQEATRAAKKLSK